MNPVAWKEITPFTEPEQSPGFLLWQVSSKWRRGVESVLSTLQLTHPQFVLLASLGWLSRKEKEVSQIELAGHCRMDITMTSQVLRSLEKRGLIQRFRQKGNQRSKYPQLTKEGSRLVEQAIPLVEEVDRAFFESLEEDHSKCVKILQKLLQGKENRE